MAGLASAAQHIGASLGEKLGMSSPSNLVRGQGAGLGSEAFIQERMRKMQMTRTPEWGTVSSASKQPQIPPAQVAMSNKPDCGEDTYKGSGCMRGLKAIISGGDSGIGRACAIGYAREGADVAVLFNINDADAEDTVRICREAGVRAIAIKCDVSSRESCRMAVERVVSELGGITTLVNNAAISLPEKPDESLGPVSEHAEKVLAVNALSNIYLAEFAVPHFTDHSGNTIIFTSSVNAYIGHNNISYTASKAAQIGMMRSLAKTYIKRGIRVNAVAPGPVWTPLVLKDQSMVEAGSSFGEGMSGMDRAAQPCELIGAYVFLASSRSSYMTGQCLHVDGGMSAAS
jgi:NAD(P)-dependent dehydrogenase (short-subunit alcohol dehydrogenase family)